MTKPQLLIADDDKSICTVLEQAAKRRNFEVITAHDVTKAMQLVEAGKGDVFVTDVLMPGGNGLDMIPRIKARRPNLPVIVISAQNTLLTAVKASQLGAYDYLPKPFDLDALMHCVEKALEASGPLSEATSAHTHMDVPLPLIGRSKAMQDIYRTLARMVDVDLTVLINGESGTGKELVARALHTLGTRKHKPFIALNMAAIPRELVESELFGHERGAFTGALNRKAGAFEQAEGGTLFLDEIGDMPMEAQTRLLRVLQQGEYTPVGSAKAQTAHVRITAATHRDLRALVTKGIFREDLYYRLNVVQIQLPRLADRPEDIPELAHHFLTKAQTKGLPAKSIAPDALALLSSHRWPGNVRELENMIYRLVTLYAEHIISKASVITELTDMESLRQPDEKPLPQIIRSHIQSYFRSHGDALPSRVHERLMPLMEKPLIEVTLEITRGNQIRAAEILGINRNTLRKRISELGIDINRKNLPDDATEDA